MLIDTECLRQVVALAKRAGDAILEVYDQDFEVWQKENQSPLTAADLAAHRVICEGLRDLYPEVPVLSEESTDGFAGPNDEDATGWSTHWMAPKSSSNEMGNSRSTSP